MAAGSILLPNGDYTPAQTFSQDGHTVKAEEVVLCDASGNIVGVTSNKLDVNASGTVTANLAAGSNNIGDVDVLTLPALPTGTNNIGDIDVLTVPADPFGANADAAVAAGATGSIQAKLRRLSTDIDAIKTSVAAATPAGTNNIGDVDLASNVADTSVTATVDALDETCEVAMPAGAKEVDFQINSTAMNNASVITFEMSMNGGTNYYPALTVSLQQLSAGTITTVLGSVIHTFGLRQYRVVAGGATHVRARLSTFNSGDALTIVGVARQGSTSGLVVNYVPVIGDVAHDIANTANTVQVGGNARSPDSPSSVVATNDRARLWTDVYGSPIVRPRRIRESYTAVFRLAETTARLDQTFTQVANTTKQWATIHRTSGNATKDLRLMKCLAYITSDTTVGIQGVVELRELSGVTTPATGNPAITPKPHYRGGGASITTCLYLPTTQGSEQAADQPLGHVPFDTGISGAVSTANPVPILDPIVLYDAGQEDDEESRPTVPISTAGGWAVAIRTVGAAVLRVTVVARFTEEIV